MNNAPQNPIRHPIQQKRIKNHQLLNQILKNPAENIRNVCVFDLDSTLFNVSPRTEKILHEYAEQQNLSDLLAVRVGPNDWGIGEALLRHGYSTEQAHDTFEDLKKFWRERFFSNDYLRYDIPSAGAVHFVHSLYKNKVEIHYLTGRDVHRMGVGTKATLLKWLFPLDDDRFLHLKPHRSIDDHEYKVNWVLDFQKNNPQKHIYFFENEPVNINRIFNSAAARETISLVHITTTHARKEDIAVPVFSIENFVIDEDEN